MTGTNDQGKCERVTLTMETKVGVVTIPAYAVPRVPGLCLHRFLFASEAVGWTTEEAATMLAFWVITHRESGRMVGETATLGMAYRWALLFGGCGDWTRPMTQIVADQGMMRAARVLRVALQRTVELFLDEGREYQFAAGGAYGADLKPEAAAKLVASEVGRVLANLQA